MKKIIFGAVALLSVLTLSACGGSSSQSGDGKTVIRVGTWEGDQAYKIQKSIATNYMKKHPKVTIKVESVPDNYGTKILTQIAGGSAPDIYQIGDGDVSMFQKKGALENLTPYMKGDNGLTLSNYYTNILDVGKISGKYYTLPKDYSTLAIYYNKDMFKKAGIAYPTNNWTWDQFREAANKLTIKSGNDYTQWGALLPKPEIRPFLPMLYSFGGDVISPNGKKVEGYMNSKGSKQALTMFNEMLNKDKVSPSTIQLDAFKGADLFLSKKVAMNMTGIWPLASYDQAKLNYGVVKVPKGPEGQFSTIYYSGYGIYSGSKNKKAAWDYLKYLSTEGQNVFAKNGLMSPYKPAVSKYKLAENPNKATFINSISIIKMFPERLNPNFGKTAGTEFTNVLTNIASSKDGNVNISAQLDAAAKKGQTEMDEAAK